MRCSLSKINLELSTVISFVNVGVKSKMRFSLSKINLELSTVISFVNAGLNQRCGAVFENEIWKLVP